MEVVKDYFQQITDIFAFDIDYVQIEIDTFHDKMEEALNQTGVGNLCLTVVQSDFESAKIEVFNSIRKCAQTANQTMASVLSDNFYPFINKIQMQQSLMPMETVANMVRSNILADAKDIIDVLENSLESSKLWWSEAVQKQVGWETRRFLVESEFALEDSKGCMAYDVVEFMLKVEFLLNDIDRCSENRGNL